MTENFLKTIFILLVLACAVIKASPIQSTESNSSQTQTHANGKLPSTATSEVATSSGSRNFPNVTHNAMKSRSSKNHFGSTGSKFKFQIKCSACKFLFSLAQNYIKAGESEDKIASFAIYMCSLMRIIEPSVCAGFFKTYKHLLFLVLSNVDMTSDQICAVILEGCGDGHLPDWSIPLTPLPKQLVKSPDPPKPGAPVSRALHISDVHLDIYYKEGSNANCGKPLCCRESSGKLVAKADAAGYWGDYRNCDIPLHTFEDMLSHIKETHKIDYVIWTGDNSPHNTWNYSKEEVISDLNLISGLLAKHFPGIPVYPAMGNHESFPPNSFPPPEIKGEDSVSWLYDAISKAWSKWLPDSTLPSIKLGAYYSVLVKPGFRIISVNMNYCNNLNLWLLLNSKDPADQLAWLSAELKKAEDKGEKVHIIGHIPPGNFDCLGVWSSNYYKIINRYKSTVTAQFFGHTHQDEFEIFYDKSDGNSRPSSIAYIGPAVTPGFGNNPSFRLYTVDGDYSGSSHVVLDHETYYMNLTEANLSKIPVWRMEYSAKKAYNLTSLSPDEWHSLIDQFKEDDGLFQNFYRFYSTLVGDRVCDSFCKENMLCMLRRGQSNDPIEC